MYTSAVSLSLFEPVIKMCVFSNAWYNFKTVLLSHHLNNTVEEQIEVIVRFDNVFITFYFGFSTPPQQILKRIEAAKASPSVRKDNLDKHFQKQVQYSSQVGKSPHRPSSARRTGEWDVHRKMPAAFYR